MTNPYGNPSIYQMTYTNTGQEQLWITSSPAIDWSSADSLAFNLTGDGSNNTFRPRIFDGDHNAWLDGPWVSLTTTSAQHVVLPFSQFTTDYNGYAFDYRSVYNVFMDIMGGSNGTYTLQLGDMHPAGSLPSGGYVTRRLDSTVSLSGYRQPTDRDVPQSI